MPYFAGLHANPRMTRNLGNGRPRLPSVTQAWLNRVLECYETVSCGHLAVVTKADGQQIGRFGLSYFEMSADHGNSGALIASWGPSAGPGWAAENVDIELGYVLDPRFWGQGYGTEAVRVVFEYSCNVLDLQRIVSYIRPDNRPSIGLATKMGARRDDEVMLVEELIDRYVWPIRITWPGQAPGG